MPASDSSLSIPPIGGRTDAALAAMSSRSAGAPVTTEPATTSLSPVAPRSLQRRTTRAPAGSTVPTEVPAGRDIDDAAQIDFTRVLWRRKWTILLLALLGIGGGLLVTYNTQPLYESFAQIYIRQNAPRILGENDLVDRTNNYVNTQAVVIRSTAVLNDALNTPAVRESRTFEGIENPLAELHRILEVELGEKTDLITVKARSPYPDDVQRIVNSVVQSYAAFVSDSHRNTAADAVTELRKEEREKLRQREELYARRNELQRQLGSVNFDGSRSTIQGLELARLSEDLIAAQTESREAKLLLDQAEAAQGNRALLDALLPPMNRTSQAEQTRLELDHARRTLRDLEYVSAANNQQVRVLRQQIEDLERDLAQFEVQDLNTRLSLLRNRYQLSADRAQELKVQYDARRAEVQDLNSKTAEADKIDSDLVLVDNWLSRVTERIQEIDVSENAGPVRPEILEAAQLGYQVAPRPATLVGMGLVLGLMSGLGLAFLQEWLDPRLRSLDEIEDQLGLPVLGAIPSLDARSTPASRARTMQEQPRSHAAEAYRDVRTTLFAALQQCLTVEGSDRGDTGDYDLEGRTILVTSPLSGEGKTTLSANLATAFARMGRKTLLIDADCRRPRVGAYLLEPATAPTSEGAVIDVGPGLSSVLYGEATLDQALRETTVANLSVLPCGPLPDDPSEILNSEAFVEMLERLAGEFDKIIIDSPPVLPVTDARVLGAVCDATVLVLRAGHSTRRGARHARDGLIRTGSNLVGVVVNDLQRSRKQFGYSAYGPYSYGYGAPYADTRPASTNGHTNGTNGHTQRLPAE